MIDDRTATLNMPLPHSSNDLLDDVARLRTSFGLIDTRFAALDALLASDDLTLDTVLELVTAIKANRTDIASIIASKVSTTTFDAAMLTKADATATTAALATKADGTATTAALATKADATATTAALATKADATTTTAALAAVAPAVALYMQQHLGGF